MPDNWADRIMTALTTGISATMLMLVGFGSMLVGSLITLITVQETLSRRTVTEVVTPDGSRVEVTERRVKEAVFYLDADGKEVLRVETSTVYGAEEKEQQP